MYWKVTYFEPTYGMRGFYCFTLEQFTKDTAWLEAGGYMYSVKTIHK